MTPQRRARLARNRSRYWFGFWGLEVRRGFEAPAFVAGLDDVAVVSETIEQCGGHLWVAEHARPFAEGEIGGDDDRGAFVEPADEME